jgi:hypothetical protein
MNKLGKALRISIVTLALPVSAHANTQNKIAQRYLDTALSHCEKGLQVPPPQSPVALMVLQRYEKKYQRYKQAALNIDGALAQSDAIYNGEFITAKSYQEIINQCELELSEKVDKAAQALAQKREQARKDQLKHAQSEAERRQFALDEALNGIQSYCFAYLAPPTPDDLSATVEGKLSLDKATYAMLRDKAAEIWPEAAKNRQRLSFSDAQGKPQTLERTLNEWYAYCDKVFADYRVSLRELRAAQKAQEEAGFADEEDSAMDDSMDDATLEDEGEFGQDEAMDEAVDEEDDAAMDDMDEEADSVDDTAAEEAASEEMPVEIDEAPADTDDTSVTEEVGAEIDEAEMEGEEMPLEMDEAAEDDEIDETAEFDALRAQVKGDRLKTLDSLGRLPDYTGNDEDTLKAKVWMFENEDTGRCEIYTFSGDKLRSKKLRDECPI